MTDRRDFIKAASALGPISLLTPSQSIAAARNIAAVSPNRDFYKELGVKPFINAAGFYSSLGGARMWPEVVDAMHYAIEKKAKMTDLHDAVGDRIAQLAQCEAAMVTAGAASAISLGTAACMTMGDEEKMFQLPDPTGMRNEVIIQESHRYTYDRAIRVPGAKLVWVESEADLLKAINEKTAMMFFFIKRDSDSAVRIERFVELGKQYNIPTFCDAATTVPPASNVIKTTAMGFDLVTFSGGKGLRGPYSAGLLLGRTDLVRFARMNNSPNHTSVGRGMKVAPEEYLGMLVALEISLKFDENGEFTVKMKKLESMQASINELSGLNVSIHETTGGGERQPFIDVSWNASRYKLTKPEMKQELSDGEPSIEIRALHLAGGNINLTVSMVKEGEQYAIADRIKEILIAHT